MTKPNTEPKSTQAGEGAIPRVRREEEIDTEELEGVSGGIVVIGGAAVKPGLLAGRGGSLSTGGLEDDEPLIP